MADFPVNLGKADIHLRNDIRISHLQAAHAYGSAQTVEHHACLLLRSSDQYHPQRTLGQSADRILRTQLLPERLADMPVQRMASLLPVFSLQRIIIIDVHRGEGSAD